MSDLPVQAGLIEGFYGTVWSHEARRGAAQFLADIGFGFYIYAPKADPLLRKRWADPFPGEDHDRLLDLSSVYKQCGLAFGVGFSPFELYLDWNGPTRKIFETKIRALNSIHVDIFCLLFDDMKGDVPGLAALQAEIADIVRQTSDAPQIILCPTYYSDDPILEKVFGAMPEAYLPELGRLLDPAIEVFWTGPKVVSSEYPVAHLQSVGERLGRKPFLWDNYPVNDGARMSKHLHLKGFEGRPAAIAPLIAGHCVNPMNQPFLSRVPIQTLADSYRQNGAYDAGTAFEKAALDLCGEEVGACLIEDIERLHTQGREAMDEETRMQLIERYQVFAANSPFAAEVVGFLRGDYVFDPACLTD